MTVMVPSSTVGLNSLLVRALYRHHHNTIVCVTKVTPVVTQATVGW